MIIDKKQFCRICDSEVKYIFNSTLLKRYNINYYYCNKCGFLQTEEPFWLKEAYDNPINISDTGYLQRNINLSYKLTILLTLFFGKNKKYLDYAGGYGALVRLMRDIGFDFYWIDKYTQNLFARGFEYNSKIAVEAITVIECFEHFVEPIDEIQNLLDISRNVIFTTELLPNPIPAPEKWWYYGFNHGQHISFYSENTFRYIAAKYHLYYSRLNNIHLLSERYIGGGRLRLLKLCNLGLDKLIRMNLRSKTWEDYLVTNENHEDKDIN